MVLRKLVTCEGSGELVVRVLAAEVLGAGVQRNWKLRSQVNTGGKINDN